MNKKWNRLLYSTIAGVLFLGNIANIEVYGSTVKMRLLYDAKMHNYEAESISIVLNGNVLPDGDMPPIVLYDRTLVPARAVFEALGAEVVWNEVTQEVYVRKEEELIVLKVDKNVATKNGETFTMDVPAKVINERTMIPVRAVSEALGCTVGWDENTRIVTIDEKVEEVIPPEDNTVVEDNNNNDNSNDMSNSNDNDTENKEDNDTKVSATEQKEYAHGGTGKIPKENVGVTEIVVPKSKSEKQVFTIMASDEIAKFQEVAGNENEIVIDVYYAQKEILTDHLEIETSDVVKEVVSSQYSDNKDVTITRIVFKLEKEWEYDIALNDDDDSVEVYFEGAERADPNVNTNENTNTNTNTDINNSSGNTNIDNDASVIIDVDPNAKPNTGNNTDTNNTTSTDVTMDTITTNTNRPNQLKNITYEPTRKAIKLSKLDLFAVDNVKHIDDYLNKKYQIILPGDYSGLYGSGTMMLNTTELVSVTVSQEGGKTAITFEENNIYAFTVTEDANSYYINIKNPKEVYDKVLVLDAGHGGRDPGTNGNNIKEKDMTLAVLQKTYSKLQNTTKVKTYVTRIGDTYPENGARASMANDIGDVFISIHMNSANPNPTPNGTEVLFITHETDKEGKLTSKAVATVLLKNVVNALGTNDRGLKYDTAEQKNLIVLNRTTVPAVIVETLFLSNPGDALKISNEMYQEQAAQAIYDSIIELADNYRWR